MKLTVDGRELSSAVVVTERGTVTATLAFVPGAADVPSHVEWGGAFQSLPSDIRQRLTAALAAAVAQVLDPGRE